MPLTAPHSYLVHFTFLSGELNSRESLFVVCCVFSLKEENWRQTYIQEDLINKRLFVVWGNASGVLSGEKRTIQMCTYPWSQHLGQCFPTKVLQVFWTTLSSVSGALPTALVPVRSVLGTLPSHVMASPQHTRVHTHVSSSSKTGTCLVLMSQLVSQGLAAVVHSTALYHPGTVKHYVLPVASKLVSDLPSLCIST